MKGIQPLSQVLLLITMPAPYREFEGFKEMAVTLIRPFWSWEVK